MKESIRIVVHKTNPIMRRRKRKRKQMSIVPCRERLAGRRVGRRGSRAAPQQSTP